MAVKSIALAQFGVANPSHQGSCAWKDLRKKIVEGDGSYSFKVDPLKIKGLDAWLKMFNVGDETYIYIERAIELIRMFWPKELISEMGTSI